MFGGHGIYVDDLFVAIVVADTLYLKADAETIPRFEGRGLRAVHLCGQGQQAGVHVVPRGPGGGDGLPYPDAAVGAVGDAGGASFTQVMRSGVGTRW
jgi:hypothetical protein